MEKVVTGGCICGGVRYAVSGPLRPVIACHCEQCRRFSGHFVAATATRKQHFQFTQQTSLKWYSYLNGYRQGFCGECGSSLFFEDENGERISIAAGSLDEPQGLTIAAHIYVAEQGDYYCITGSPASAVSMAAGGEHQVALP